jgi:ribonuclease VapC
VIVVDTSAIFAVLNGEAMATACSYAIENNEPLLVSAGTLAEARVVAARRGWSAKLEEFVARIDFEIVPVTTATAEAVGRAYEKWGKGLHRASLNFGDCFAYALARERNCPLLFIGNDFSQTDLVSALQ